MTTEGTCVVGPTLQQACVGYKGAAIWRSRLPKNSALLANGGAFAIKGRAAIWLGLLAKVNAF